MAWKYPLALTIEFIPNLPTIVTNATALEQVFTNLIGNAIEHHHRLDGRVEILANLQDDVDRRSIARRSPDR